MKSGRLAAALLVLAVVWTSSYAGPPTLAVVPLHVPDDSDYAVLISDRIAEGLLAHSGLPGTDLKRFVLMEPDTLDDEVIARISGQTDHLSRPDLVQLREAVRTDFVLVGREPPGDDRNPAVKHLVFRLIEMATGDVLWSGGAKHDIRFLWNSKQWEGGRTLVQDVMEQMGFVATDNKAVSLENDVPRRVAILPLSNSANPELANICARAITREVIGDSLFILVRGVGQSHDRISESLRHELTKKRIDAVLTGSLMDLGMEEEDEDNLTVALRLIEVATGRILWCGSASERRLWWKELPDVMTEKAAGRVVAKLADAVRPDR